MELREELKKLWKKSVADGEECMKKEEFEEAIAFFEVGLDIAIKFPKMFHPSDTARVRVEIASAQLKLKKYDSALDILHNLMSIEDNIPEGHTLMSQVFLEMGDNISASCSLLRGMEKCQLNEEQQLNFITMAATLLANLKLGVVNGDHKEEDIFTVNNIKPNLPSSLSVWKDVIHCLWQKNAVAALAFITSGLPGPQASILEKAAAYYGCSCEEIEIQMIYEALSPAQLRGWGNLLAIFILEHGGTIAWQPEETSVIVIIKNSLKSGSAELLKWALKGGIDNNHLDNRTIFGDTALHFLVKSRPFTQLHEEMVHLLISHGALPNILDSTGNIPIHYIKQSEVPSVFGILSEALQKPNEGFKKRISDLKAKGNAAHQSKNHHLAIFFYEVAINVLEASQYDMRCDKAVLYSCMTTEYTTLSCDDLAFAVVDKRRADPIFHKPYWRIGKCLIDSGKVLEASTVFMEGLACEDMDSEQRLQILQDICSNLSTLSESQVNSIVSKMAPFLPTSWPKLVETLSKTASAKSWDVIRCLVLGPPEKEVAKTIVNPGWKFADRFKDGEKLKVGYAMCLKAQTPVLSTLAEVVDGNEGSKVREWATDLTLALLLQGAELSKLATSDEETGYHVALHMCCQTGKLGLLKYILSDAKYLQEARQAVNKEARTLLHATCLEFGHGSHPVGEELVKLLCEKEFDHSFKDKMQKKAIQYLNPDSPMCQLLSAQQVAKLQSSKELIRLGNSEFKKGNNAAANRYYSQAIDAIKLKLPPLGSATAGREHSEAKHELAVLLNHRAECYIKMEKIEEALNDAKESVSWDGNWYKVEELDEDEKVSYMKKIKDAADQEAHRKSALIIYRFIKSFMLWKRLPQLKKWCVVQVERELFASSLISNAMCGVCGVGFEKSSTGEVEESVVHDGEEEEEKESGEMVQERIKQEHLDSEGHKRNAAEYQTFRQIYRSHLAMPLFQIRGSLSFYQVKKNSAMGTEEQWNPVYRDIPYHLETLTTLLQDLSHKLQEAIQKRKWTQWPELVGLSKNLFQNFGKTLPHIQHRFETATQQQAEAREREHHHQEWLMEDMVEDPDMDEEIVHVVGRSAHYTAHNPSGGAGDSSGGHNYGHGHGYGHGQGRSYHRGQGNFGADHWGEEFVHDMRDQEREAQNQFYEGDLPPRFRR